MLKNITHTHSFPLDLKIHTYNNNNDDDDEKRRMSNLTGVPQSVLDDLGDLTTFAKPKSATLIDESSSSLVKSKFSGLRSRCATLRL